jgi:hypothetical protein
MAKQNCLGGSEKDRAAAREVYEWTLQGRTESDVLLLKAQVGLLLTVVAEASLTTGALINAEFRNEYGR